MAQMANGENFGEGGMFSRGRSRKLAADTRRTTVQQEASNRRNAEGHCRAPKTPGMKTENPAQTLAELVEAIKV